MKTKTITVITAVLIATIIFILLPKKKDTSGGGDQVKQLEVVDQKEGKGNQVIIGNSVTIHYTGWRWDGVMFDNSYDRGPVTFRVGEGRVMRGWEQGVLGMKVGGKRKLTVPPDMATGVTGTGGAIPLNAALVYEIELLKIQ
jgi:FKBP-type peptidyl-prolyl cis-trans isomerase FkpA